MYWTDESRAFLAAVHEAGGRATMRDIRNRADLTEGQRQHQFTKLESAGVITVERAKGLTANGTSMKVAVLTQAAVDEIQTGVLNGSTNHSRRGSVDVTELADQIDETQQYISKYIRPKFAELTELRRRIEAVENSV
jgi:hypothetical protein